MPRTLFFLKTAHLLKIVFANIHKLSHNDTKESTLHKYERTTAIHPSYLFTFTSAPFAQ